MKPLPVPPLAQTLERYLDAVRPLLDDAAYTTTSDAVAAFAAGDGRACQAALEEFAATRHGEGASWLWDAWLSAYHTSRDPLPFVSNVGFQLRWDTEAPGLARAADLVHRFAAVHLAHLRGDAEPDVSPRGDALCMQQWAHLAGGVRHPRPEEDQFLPGRPDAAHREVVVLWHGNAVAIAVSDASGRPIPRPALEAALAQVVALPPAPAPGFTAASHLTSDAAAAHLDALLADPHNTATYARLRDALFLVNLTAAPASHADHLRRSAFGSGQSWTFKPVTYQVSLADDRFVAVHVEHSTFDGATLRTIVLRAQQVEPSDADAPTPAVEPLTWVLDADLAATLTADLATYEADAAAYRVRILRVPTPAADEVPFRFSQDAVLQFVMLYAQLAAHGRVRSTYESVDMREYQAGRTECLRPNTAEAVALVRGLRDGTATLEHLHAALEGHRQRVKQCKGGQAIDRHLFGLRLMATRDGLAAPLFDDPGHAALTTDFLSTTSVGDQDAIVRYAFAPTSDGGLGVQYTPLDGAYEFCVSYVEGRAERVEEFLAALAEGTERVWGLIATAPRG